MGAKEECAENGADLYIELPIKKGKGPVLPFPWEEE